MSSLVDALERAIFAAQPWELEAPIAIRAPVVASYTAANEKQGVASSAL